MIKKPIKIKIFEDAKEDNRISIDIYFRSIYNNLKKIIDPKKIVLLSSNFKIYNIFPNIFNFNLRFFRYIVYPIIYLFTQKRINHILDQSYAHLLFLSFKNSKNIVTVHDLIPLLSWSGKIETSIYPKKPYLFLFSISSLYKADKIIAVSECTKKDLISECGINPKKISVIYNGVDNEFRILSKIEKTKYRDELNLNKIGIQRVLIVGDGAYKNVSTSFEVIKHLEKDFGKKIQLVWLGANAKSLARNLQTSSLKVKPVFLSNLTQDQIIGLYNIVDCLLFPSFYEGFGMPPIEAMRCGLPVVTSNIDVFKEVYGNAVEMKSPYDAKGLAECVSKILKEDSFSKIMISNGLEHSLNFSWKKNSSSINKIYNEILDSESISA